MPKPYLEYIYVDVSYFFCYHGESYITAYSQHVTVNQHMAEDPQFLLTCYTNATGAFSTDKTLYNTVLLHVFPKDCVISINMTFSMKVLKNIQHLNFSSNGKYSNGFPADVNIAMGIIAGGSEIRLSNLITNRIPTTTKENDLASPSLVKSETRYYTHVETYKYQGITYGKKSVG